MLELDPDHVNAAYARGACENKRGNFAKAIAKRVQDPTRRKSLFHDISRVSLNMLALDGPRSAVGRAVVVREGRDDAASADGAAGDVIGCGVLEGVR